MENNWISVNDRPLYHKTELGWETTKDGDQEFLAAIQEGGGWWIHHCTIEDQTGLVVIGDDYNNEPAGYDLEDIQYWQPIEPPKP